MSHYDYHFHRTQPIHLKGIPWDTDATTTRGDIAVLIVCIVIGVIGVFV